MTIVLHVGDTVFYMNLDSLSHLHNFLITYKLVILMNLDKEVSCNIINQIVRSMLKTLL